MFIQVLGLHRESVVGCRYGRKEAPCKGTGDWHFLTDRSDCRHISGPGIHVRPLTLEEIMTSVDYAKGLEKWAPRPMKMKNALLCEVDR